MTLPAYCSWNTMKDYYYYIDSWMIKINNFCNNNSQTADIANSDSIIEESSYHKTNESAESNSPLQASPVANKSDELNAPLVANENNELNSPSQVLLIANKSADNESTKLNLSIQAPPVAVPEKVSVEVPSTKAPTLKLAEKVSSAEVFVVVETQTSKMKMQQKYYDIFLSQIPAHQSITLSQLDERVSEIMSNQDFTMPEGKSDVVFKLSLSKEFRDLKEKFIIFII
ncbi:hypothetical protein RhiirB3_392905 [Rhizophagus irregularis]|nr:hypothetical protein RhiirB3_392905 [Rhizophagus irregularis]